MGCWGSLAYYAARGWGPPESPPTPGGMVGRDRTCGVRTQTLGVTA